MAHPPTQPHRDLTLRSVAALLLLPLAAATWGLFATQDDSSASVWVPRTACGDPQLIESVEVTRWQDTRFKRISILPGPDAVLSSSLLDLGGAEATTEAIWNDLLACLDGWEVPLDEEEATSLRQQLECHVVISGQTDDWRPDYGLDSQKPAGSGFPEYLTNECLNEAPDRTDSDVGRAGDRAVTIPGCE